MPLLSVHARVVLITIAFEGENWSVAPNVFDRRYFPSATLMAVFPSPWTSYAAANRGVRSYQQAMQLASKMRFVSAQFVALLSDDLWKRNAVHANAMAARLAAGVDGVAGVQVTDVPQANAVFAILDPRAIATLQDEFAFYTWNEATHQVRWMTSWATTEGDVDTFVTRIREVVATTTT